MYVRQCVFKACIWCSSRHLQSKSRHVMRTLPYSNTRESRQLSPQVKFPPPSPRGFTWNLRGAKKVTSYLLLCHSCSAWTPSNSALTLDKLIRCSRIKTQKSGCRARIVVPARTWQMTPHRNAPRSVSDHINQPSFLLLQHYFRTRASARGQ